MEIDISKLKAHSFNRIFGDLPKEEFEALRNDIKVRGMQSRIDITEDNIIVCGHQRVRACKELGIIKVNAHVLKGWTEEQVKEHLIKDNVLRRQLTPFQVVEAGKELKKIYEGRKGAHVDKCPHDKQQEGKTRDLVAKDFGISGRTYERYEKIYNHAKNTKRNDLIKKEKQGLITITQIKKEMKPIEEPDITDENQDNSYNELKKAMLKTQDIIAYVKSNIKYYTPLEIQNLKDFTKELQNAIYELYKKLDSDEE